MCGVPLRGSPRGDRCSGGGRWSEGMRDHRLDKTIGRRATRRQARNERQFRVRVLRMSLVW